MKMCAGTGNHNTSSIVAVPEISCRRNKSDMNEIRTRRHYTVVQVEAKDAALFLAQEGNHGPRNKATSVVAVARLLDDRTRSCEGAERRRSVVKDP
jgi:Ulp1 family protease